MTENIKRKTVGILGIGNYLVRDEGFGVHFIERLTKQYDLPDNIEVLDGGTAGIMLSPFIEQLDILYVIDTVAIDGEPGTIHRFTDKDVRSGNIATRLSPHQVGLLEILDICRLRDKAPQYVEMITVIPEDLTSGIELTKCLEPKLDEVMQILLAELKKIDCDIRPKE